MTRMFLSLVAVAFLISLHPHAAAAAQQPAAPRSGAKAPVAGVAAVINLNSASATDLATLPGIGAKTAARIVEYRQKNGPFKKIEDILEKQSSCPYLLNVSSFSAHRSVSRNR